MKRLFLLSFVYILIASVAIATPRYIFYFIGDGMGMGHVTTTETYNRTILKSSKPLTMMQFTVAGIAQTYSASSPVTDSAAAGTALATGHKTTNGMLGMTPDTTAVNSIAYQLKKRGYGIGIITTVAPDDATPAAFYAHVASRKMFYEIDCQAAEANIDFLAGASLRGRKDKNGNDTDVISRFKKNNVTITNDINVARSTRGKVLLVGKDDVNLNNNNLGYTVDSVAETLSLPDITQACLDHLNATSPDRFFMMVEGGNIDHAAHANDGAGVIKEIINFNQAIDIAYKFYLNHPDETLIVITADHDTGGMALSGGYDAAKNNLTAIDYQHISKDKFTDSIRNKIDNNETFLNWSVFRDFLKENFGLDSVVKLTPDQELSLKNKYEKVASKNDESTKGLYNTFDSFTSELYRTVNLSCGIKWISGSHSGNPVPVYAIGVGAQRFSSLNNNIDIPKKIMAE